MIIFAFANTNSKQILDDLKFDRIEKITINGHLSIQKLIDHIKQSSPRAILGLGEYGGRDTDMIRIETLCKNKFRNSHIAENSTELLVIKPFIQPCANLKYGLGIGNSWCNLVSYRIRSEAQKTPYTFLHIPKSFNQDVATAVIQERLNSAVMLAS